MNMTTARLNVRLRWILSMCVTCGALISCGGGNSTVDNAVESPLGASESVITSAIEDSIVSASAITTTDEGLAQERSKSLITAQSDRAFELYDGKLGEVTLTAKTAGMFASTLNGGWVPDTQIQDQYANNESNWAQLPWSLLRRLPLIGFIPNANAINPAPGETNCDQQGKAFFTLAPRDQQAKISYAHLHIRYDECMPINSEFVYTGEVELILKLTSSFSYPSQKPDFVDSGSHYWPLLYEDVVIAYDGLSIKRGARGVKIDGVLDWPKTNFCGENGAMTTTLLVVDQVTEQQILIDHLQSGWRSAGGVGYNSCDRDINYPNYLAGNVYIASEGKVSTKTNDWFIKNSNQSYWRNVHLMLSSNDTRAEFKEIANPEEEYAINGRATERVIALSVFDSNGSEIDNIKMVPNMAEAGAMIDMGDADADGMNNSWEIVAGLDPHDPSDANLDLDGDGISNHVEFQSRGHPDNPLVSGLNFDAELVFRVAEVVYQKNYRHDIQYNYSMLGLGYMDPVYDTDYLVMSPDKAGTWKTYDKYQCRVSLDSNDLHCAERVGEHVSASFTPDESGLLTMTTTVSSGKYDYWPENNTHTVVVDFQ